MILSELLGLEVRLEDHRVGHVIDVRLVPAGTNDHPVEPTRIYGFVISPHARTSSLGYERSEVRSPWPIGALERWRHRDSFLVPWADVEAIHRDHLRLRPGARRYQPILLSSARHRPDFGDHQH